MLDWMIRLINFTLLDPTSSNIVSRAGTTWRTATTKTKCVSGDDGRRSRERTPSTYEVNEKNLFDALYNQVLKAIISSYKKSQMSGERKAYSDFCQICRSYDRLYVNGSFFFKRTHTGTFNLSWQWRWRLKLIFISQWINNEDDVKSWYLRIWINKIHNIL